MRPRQILTLGAIVLAFFLTYTVLRLGASQQPKLTPDPPSSKPNTADTPPAHAHDGDSSSSGDTVAAGDAPTPIKHKPAPGGSHPMWHLIKDAEARSKKGEMNMEKKTNHKCVLTQTLLNQTLSSPQCLSALQG